jgi:hypothetical protein
MLSFKGFPLGIISFVGFMLLITGWTPAISAMFHPMGAPTSRRLIVIFIGFAIASLGRAVVDWSGLAFINIGSLKVSIAQLGAYVGIFGGLFNLDKSMSSSSNIFPDASLK